MNISELITNVCWISKEENVSSRLLLINNMSVLIGRKIGSRQHGDRKEKTRTFPYLTEDFY